MSEIIAKWYFYLSQSWTVSTGHGCRLQDCSHLGSFRSSMFNIQNKFSICFGIEYHWKKIYWLVDYRLASSNKYFSYIQKENKFINILSTKTITLGAGDYRATHFDCHMKRKLGMDGKIYFRYRYNTHTLISKSKKRYVLHIEHGTYQNALASMIHCHVLAIITGQLHNPYWSNGQLYRFGTFTNSHVKKNYINLHLVS